MPGDRVICVNFPVADLKKSTAFFLSLGLKLYDEYSGEESSCPVIGENACVMLLAHPFFQGFIPGIAISGARAVAEVIVSISAPDRKAADEMIE